MKTKHPFSIDYDYKIKLVNQKDKPNYEKNLHNSFINDGSVFGLNDFYDLNKLESDGFINNDGSIEIEFSIRPTTVDDFEKECIYSAI